RCNLCSAVMGIWHIKLLKLAFRARESEWHCTLHSSGATQGWINERAHELRGPLSQSLCVQTLVCISYLWLEKVYVVHLLMALIECTCVRVHNNKTLLHKT